MKKIAVLITTLFLCCNGHSQKETIAKKVTQQMFDKQRKLSSKHIIQSVEEETAKFLDSMTVDKTKILIEKALVFFRSNKRKLKKYTRDYHKRTNEQFNKLTKSYLPEDEEFSTHIYPKLVTNNHLIYRDTLQQGTFFNQFYSNNESKLKAIFLDCFTTFKFSSTTSLSTFYQLNSYSQKDLKILNIYYHDGTEKNVPIAVEPFCFPFNSIPTPNMKRIDSLQMEFNVNYLSKVDSVHFNKNEIGVTKKYVKLLNMNKNYVELELPKNNYQCHKGYLHEEYYFNKDGKSLDTEYGYSNISLETPKEEYQNKLDYLEEANKYLRSVKTKQELSLMLNYLDLKQKNKSINKRSKRKIALKGNVSSMTLYFENQRDTIIFKTMMRNSAPKRNMYVHELEGKTEFIDNNGVVITSIPSEIEFAFDSKIDLKSDKYFYTGSYKNKSYYFLDDKKKEYTKLPYSEMEFLCPSIIIAYNKEKEGWVLLSSKEHKLYSDDVFSRYLAFRYTVKEIQVFTKDGDTYLLYDQNGNLITENSNQEITKVVLK